MGLSLRDNLRNQCNVCFLLNDLAQYFLSGYLRPQVGYLELWIAFQPGFSAATLCTQNGIQSDCVRVRTHCRSYYSCLLYTSDAADDLLCVDLGGRRIIKKKKKKMEKPLDVSMHCTDYGTSTTPW